MSELVASSDLVEVLKLVPSIAWVGFAVYVVVLFREPILRLLPGLSTLEFPGGFKAQFEAGLAEAARGTGAAVSDEARTTVERRLAREVATLRGSRVLWIDDAPGLTRTLREALDELGVRIDMATSNEAAAQRLSEHRYDAVISDIDRDGDATAGLVFLETIRRHDGGVPVIFYILKLDLGRGTPPDAFGITNRPDELTHLLLDALARRRG